VIVAPVAVRRKRLRMERLKKFYARIHHIWRFAQGPHAMAWQMEPNAAAGVLH
jgi:hypothetical protein